MADPKPQYPAFNELAKFAMFTPSPGVENRRAKLAWVVRDGNPRVTVSPNNPSDTARGPINAAMNPETFEIFLNEFERIINSPSPEKMKIDCFRGVKDANDKYGNEKVLDSELFFGKNDEGMVWISVVSGERPKIVFEFNISDYHKIHRSTGPISKAEASVMQANAVINAIRRVFTQYYREFKAKAPARTEASVNTQGAKPGGSSFEDITF